MFKFYSMLFALVLLSACDRTAINSPYPEAEEGKKIMYTSFSLRPKHLDPARSYSANENIINGQIYEPPYQYHYLKRPYQLELLTAAQFPEVTYLNAAGERIPDTGITEDSVIAFTRYVITLQPGIVYQPHPAFVKNADGSLKYGQLSETDVRGIRSPAEFKQLASRELQAADYVNQIKRLAHPEVHSPILGLMRDHIVGLGVLAEELSLLNNQGLSIDLTKHDIEGVQTLSSYQYEIIVNGQYPQLKYWLAMPFFAPIPWEADQFYQQSVLISKNITLDWFPIGTGPFMMVTNDPNRQMVLKRNPFFHGETYPTEGEEGDAALGLLDDAGLPMPFLDKVVFTLEKESTSYWGKFLQGYYDASGVTSDGFDQAVSISSSGEFGLSDAMKAKGIALDTAIRTSTFYIGFNMRDPVVGGDSDRARNLRNAIAIAIDQNEFISIFANGQGIPAQGPIPPGIFGYREGEVGIDPFVYQWKGGEVVSRPIKVAKQLLAEAGYPQGRDQQTGEPLVLYFDVSASGPDQKAQLDWMRKQLRKIDLQLVVRSTDYNRFQEKMRRGTAQIFRWGWNADYPDPENFLFLLYGPNAKAKTGGENAANYQNVEFDRLFEKMRVMPDGDMRQQIIDEMIAIARHDVPWVWGYHPQQFNLYHAWNKNVKTSLMGSNTFKYRRMNVALREQLQSEWNQPIVWPLGVIAISLLVILLPAFILYRRKRYQA